jgi:hypothetical protein
MHQDATIDASNMIEVFIDPVNWGLGIASVSGHVYSSVVPEPTAHSLVVVGLIVGTVAARPLFPHGRRPHPCNKAT